jgi:flagellar biosynthesis/type III secretory pathway chaperone
MDRMQEHLMTLEDVLVKEFRACQILNALSREERQALSASAVAVLLDLVEQKEGLLDDLGNLEDRRRMLVQELACLCGLRLESPTLADVLTALPPDQEGRLGRLREGILTLLASVRDLTHGNRALAASAIERADAVQSFLLDLYEPATSYRPAGLPPAPAALVAWDLDQKA